VIGSAAHLEQLGDQPQFWLDEPGADPPVLYLHGVPTSSELWRPFLARTGGVAPDLPGFGRSGKRGDRDYTIAGLDRWLDAFLDLAGLDRVRLVAHDWGAIGLLWAQRAPERVERLAVLDAVPLLPGFRWHRVARAWRTPGLGEVVMGFTGRRTARRAVPAAIADAVWPFFDQGTQRAILHLYRSSPEDALARAGLDLASVACPALVVWGEEDPYVPARFADGYAAALGGPTETVRVPGAGHWPWLDRPDVVDRVAAFLDA
jgi:pimeloyl-ACP methyl ester carboxylesterase